MIKNAWFQLCGGRKWLLFESGSHLSRFLSRGIEIDLILKWGSKLTWFQWWDLNELGFCMRNRNWLGFSLEIGIDLFFVRGSNWLSFCVRAENYLVSMYGSKLTWFSCAGRKWLFSGGIDWFVFVWVVQIDLVFTLAFGRLVAIYISLLLGAGMEAKMSSVRSIRLNRSK